MSFFNPDGTQSFCGNGSRCAFAFWSKLTGAGEAASFTAIDGEHTAQWTNGLVRISMRDVKSIGHAAGGLVAQMATDRLDLHVINQHTDRIYLADGTGLIQCLREIDATRPTVYAPPPVGEEAAKPKDPKAKASGDMTEMPAEDGAEGAEKPMTEGEMTEGDMKEAPAEAPTDDAAADKATEEKPAEEMEKKDE